MKKKYNPIFWYSNRSLKIICARSILVAILGIMVIFIVGEEDNLILLLIVITVPLILGLVNSIKKKLNEEENNT